MSVHLCGRCEVDKCIPSQSLLQILQHKTQGKEIPNLLCLPLSVMASGGPMMNGDISRSPGQSGTLEETLQQMNILIQENRDLKGKTDWCWWGQS